MNTRLCVLASGRSIHTVRWLNVLADRGWDVFLLTQDKPIFGFSYSVKIHKLPFVGTKGYLLNVLAVRKILRELKPDLLHVHYASGYGLLGRLAGFHPLVLSVWGSDVYDFPYKSGVNKKLLQANLKSADWVCSTSHAMGRETLKHSPSLSNLSITPFGIDTRQFSPQGKSENDTIVIGTVKTMSYRYGIDLLIRGFALAQNQLNSSEADQLAGKIRLLIVGGGEELAAYQLLSKQLGLESVSRFVGAVSHDQVSGYLNQLDVYVASSRAESFGVTVLEASACGVPVVVSDVGGLPEVVVDGGTGFVVPCENPAAIARALVKLIESPALRDEMGKAGRQFVVNRYDWEKSVDIMEDVYHQVLDQTRSY